MTSKYEPLKQHFLGCRREPLQMSFCEIERVIGLPLPMSARAKDSWWLDKTPNKHRAHARAWLDAGFQIGSVDRTAEIVKFVLTREYGEPALLSDVSFPIEKLALLRRAQQIQVPVPVREALERLPDVTYYSRHDFVVAVEALVSA